MSARVRIKSKVSFPYLFVLEVADGKRAAQRGLPSEHRLHLHAIMFGCPLPWWRVRHDILMSFGLAWVSPLRHFGAVRYAMKYITKKSAVHWNDIPKEILDLAYRDWETDRKSTRLNSSHITRSRMPSSA